MNKKNIRIGLFGFWKDFNIFNSKELWCEILRNDFNIVLDNKNPDYLIVNTMGPAYEFLKIKCKIRILITRENLTPDFNIFDYAFTSYPIKFLDRHFYYPQFIMTYKGFESLTNNFKTMTNEDLNNKTHFANFIYSHDSRDNERSIFFNVLSQYKQISSPGRYLCNEKNFPNVKFNSVEKYNFQKQCKFSICFESVCQYGFITEKITDAFSARTIPIYCGSDTINSIFNPKSFVNINNFNNYNEVVEYIKKIDNNDALYLKLVNEKPLINPNYFSNLKKELKIFIDNIFIQDINKAHRRTDYLMEKKYLDHLSLSVKYRKLMRFFNLPFKFFRKYGKK